MGFTEKKYAYGMEDKNWFPTVPATEEDARKQFQNMFDQILKLLNDLVKELDSKTGESGADKIGSAAIGGVAGLNVRAQIQSLKDQVDGVVLKQIPDESLINSKLSSDIKIGSLAALTTTDKSSVQSAINELDGEIGDLSKLTTAVKSSLVGAISQLNDVPVTESKIVDGAVTEMKIGEYAVTAAKIMDGQVTQPKLGTIQQITLASGDTLVYDNTSNTLRLKVAECLATNPNGVQLAPIVYGTSATPPSGNYPAGTIYIQYEA